MEFIIHEVVPEACNKSVLGRVVVDPPKVMGQLKSRRTGKIYMCCNRAYLTEEAYMKHASEKKEHGKALDLSKFSKPNLEETKKQPGTSRDYDRTNRKLWRVTKNGCAKDSEDESDAGSETKENKPRDAAKQDVQAKRKTGKVCPHCGIIVYYSNLKRHIKDCHVPDGVKCDYCPCAFLLNTSRLRHQTTFHRVGVKKKSIVARAKKQLVVSSKTTQPPQFRKRSRNFACSICGRQFPGKNRLNDHMNSHSGLRPYKCETCGFRFSHRSNLERHKRKSHTKNDKYFCTICNCSFPHSRLLVRHNKAIHPNNLNIKQLRPAISPTTKKGTVSSETPDSSKGVGSCPSPNSSGLYECKICHKELSSQQTWRGHMLIHQNLKPNTCKFCGINFRLRGTMTNHILTSHSGGKFKCKNCTCRFKSQRPLDRHMQIYHSVSRKLQSKPPPSPPKSSNPEKTKATESPKKSDNTSVAGFKCNLCGTVVRLLADFEVHKTLHNGANPTQCNLCLKKLGSIVNLKFHKDRAHGDPKLHVHSCAFCCCRYKVSQALFSHLVKEHGMEREDWDFTEKLIKPAARKRIQLKLCQFETKQPAPTESPKKTAVEKQNVPATVDSDTDKLTKMYECDICHLKFKLRRSVGNHKKKAHNLGTYVCGICPCRYNKLTWLKKHQLRAHGRLKLPKKTEILEQIQSIESVNNQSGQSGAVSCDLCQFRLKNQRCLANHMKTSHCKSGKFKCKLCPCKFKSSQGVVVHLSKVHGQFGKRNPKNVDTSVSSDIEVDSESEQQSNETGSPAKPDKDKNANTSSINQYECELCHMKFTSSSVIRKHKKTAHFNSGKYKCTKCTCTFLTPGGLHVHKRLHIGKSKKSVMLKTSKVGGATRFTGNSKQTDAEMESETLQSGKPDKMLDPRRIKCQLCSCMILRDQIRSHKKTSHGSGSYACPNCTCTFDLPNGLRRHRVFYHGFKGKTDITNDCVGTEDNNESNEVDRSTSKSKVNLNFLKIRSSPLSKRNSTKRLSSPSKTSPVKQEDDSKSPTKGNSSSATTYKYKCDRCGIKFIHSIHLRRHEKKAHLEGGIPCDLCTCSFENTGTLAAHKRVYHNPTVRDNITAEKPQHKPTVATTRSVLTKVEKTVVTNESKVQSSKFKSKTFSTSTNKQVDKDISVSTETRTRSRSSKVESSTSSPLNNEVQSEESSKPHNLSPANSHQCTWCSKKFPSLKMLDKHILSHTRPEVCRKCQQRFRTKDEVLKHIKIAHDPNSMHQCTICSCRFATPTGLKAHTTLIHKKQPAYNIEIIHDECTEVDNDPFMQVGSSSFGQPSIEQGISCEDSEPIVQGILQAYPSNGFDTYNNRQGYSASVEETLEGDTGTGGVYEDSEPIVQGIIEYNDSNALYAETNIASGSNKQKNPFSPKSRPIKCSSCGMTCYGPENLRMHMQLHQQNNENESMQVNSDMTEYSNVKCEKCMNEFPTSHELAQHLQLEHDETGLYRCAYCPCTMKTETNLRYHFMKYHSG